MEQPFKLEKFDWSNVTSDFRKMQQISAIGVVAATVLSVFILFTSGLNSNQMANLTIVGFLIVPFILVYYLFPKLYLNKNLLFLPSLIGTVTIASIMIILRERGDVFIVFLIYSLVTNAFMLPNFSYYFNIFSAAAALFLVHYILMGNIFAALSHQSFIFQVYGLVSVGIIVRLFATETISLRNKEEALREKAKELLTQKKELFQLIENINDGIIAVDSEQKISLINKTALKILGIVGPTKIMIGKDVNKILTTVSTDGQVSIIEETLNKKDTIVRDDLRLVQHDRTLRLHTNAAPIFNEDNEIHGVIVLFRDITNEKKIEEQRAEFNAIASHELRTPLTVIEGYLYYLMTDKSLKYDRKTKDFIEKSHEASDQLLHLTNDILTVVKSDENELKVALEEIDIKKLAEDTAVQFKEKAKSAKVKIIFKAEENVPKVVTDEGKIKEVISNLVENAIKFTEKGSVKVEVSVPKEGEVIVAVSDTGIGISKEDQKMIFHKFFRTEDWQTRKRGGTGLGLFIAKTFIERLGGKIGVMSTKGKGSTFWFSLPTKPKVGRKKNKEELNEFIKSL